MNFERGQDPKHTLKIGKRAQIDEWFEEWAPDIRYTVDENLHISVRENLYLVESEVSYIPDNLTIQGALYIRDTKITSLPDSLDVGFSAMKDF